MSNKKTRIKPSAMLPVIRNLAETDSALARLAALKRSVSFLETGMQEEIDAVKLKAAQKAEPFRQEIADLETALARFGAANKDDLFTGKQRSRSLTFGIIGFRASSELGTIGKTTWADVQKLIEDKCLEEKYLRTKLEVDKEALRKADTETLKSLRCTIREKDEFYIELEEHGLNSTDNGGRAA